MNRAAEVVRILHAVIPDAWKPFIPSARLQGALVLFAVAIAGGTVGYMVLSDMGFVDALYQTVTTLSTVGFRELKPFGTAEKLFTVFLIVFGTGTALYTLTLFMQEAVEGDYRSRFYRRKERMQIADLREHHIVCGFGRVGQEVAREFRERRVPFVVVERNPEQVELARAFGYLVVEGDASEERALNAAGLAQARTVLAASDSDSGNTYIALTAKSINPGCYVVARASSPHNEEKLRLAGADRILSLYTYGGRQMVLSALQPLAADFMDTIASGREGDLVLAEFEADDTNGLEGKTLGNLLERSGGGSFLGIRRRGGGLIVGPPSDYTLAQGDIAIVLGGEAQIAAMVRAEA